MKMIRAQEDTYDDIHLGYLSTTPSQQHITAPHVLGSGGKRGGGFGVSCAGCGMGSDACDER